MLIFISCIIKHFINDGINFRFVIGKKFNPNLFSGK